MASLRRQLGALAAMVASVIALCAGLLAVSLSAPPEPPAERVAAATRRTPTFAGAASCVRCHGAQTQLWHQSHHDLAMQPATVDTVQGDFDDVTLDHLGVVSRFFRRDDRYVVATDGPDGVRRAYEVAYVFGVSPLQQYMVQFPGGRLQVLPLCWDTRPAEEGGQRWFHLYPNEPLPPDDELHWTGPRFNWNFMCAECHSTHLQKRYDAKHRTYETRWTDIDVACEACHGPAARHVAWAELREQGYDITTPAAHGLVVSFADSEGARWVMDPGAHTAHLTSPRRNGHEIDLCARCHARRSNLVTPYRYGVSLLQTHAPSLLTDPLYYPDGQIRNEVYVYGSFLQSRMFRSGVTCSDCHDPHSLALPGDGADAVCAKCHRPAHYAARSHHGHDPQGEGGSCVSCHMPSSIYMVVDARRDHSLRIPRPDLSAAVDVPNACTGCHADQTIPWAQAAIRGWYPRGDETPPHFAHAFAAADAGDPRATSALVAVANDAAAAAIVRASALARLRDFRDPAAVAAATAATATHPSPLIRYGAALALGAARGEDTTRRLLELTHDPILAVRLEATRAAARVRARLPRESGAQLDYALDELVQAELVNSDTAAAHLKLGVLYTDLDDAPAAERHYREALELEPRLAQAHANLADLLRATGRDAQAGAVLQRALELTPDSAPLLLARGMWLVRQGQHAPALKHFARAASLDPDPVSAYVLGVALSDAGDTAAALRIWRHALERHPFDRNLLVSLLTTHYERGERGPARVVAERLRQFYARDPAVDRLLRQVAD